MTLKYFIATPTNYDVKNGEFDTPQLKKLLKKFQN